jgi:THO complex subunit 3
MLYFLFCLGGSFSVNRVIMFLSSHQCFFVFFSGGKCQTVELSGENINITYKHDGTQIAVGNKVCTA